LLPLSTIGRLILARVLAWAGQVLTRRSVLEQALCTQYTFGTLSLPGTTMTAIHETAYPRIRSNLTDKDLRAVRQEVDRLKTLYDGFHYRELARILFITFGTPIDHKTVKTLWQASPVACQGHLALWDYHAQPDRYQARLQVIQLYDRGGEKVSSSRFLHVSRPTVDAWIPRFEPEHFAGRVDRSRAPKAPVRKIWLPLMVQVYHLQKAQPDAGAFRSWSLLARSDVSVRTIGRVMALNRLVYDDIPHVRRPGVKPAPAPHPYKARYRHQY
jgi:hypothetical protein